MLGRAAVGAAFAATLACCGSGAAASRGGPSGQAHDGTSHRTLHAEAAALAETWRTRAVAAYLEGDLARAATAARNALQADPTDARAQEVAARVALAARDAARALEVLGAARAPVLVRLRARAHLLEGDARAALRDVESVADDEPTDGWAVAITPSLRALGDRTPYAIEGSAIETVAYAPASRGAGLPLVAASLDGRAALALVSTAAGTTVLDPGAPAAGPVVGRLGLGSLTVHNVPVVTRDLSDVRDATGADVRMVIGAELLLRLHATLDGPGARLVLHATAPLPPSPAAQRLPLHAFEGSLLAVPLTVAGGHPAASAVGAADSVGRAGLRGAMGLYVLDTGARFFVAVTERAVRGAGADPLALPRPPGAPEGVRLWTAPVLMLGEAAITDVPAIVGLVPDDLARIAGTRIDGILGQLALGQLVVTLAPSEGAVYFAQPSG
jgi:hypothetical protein